ncbi:24782_t:CDS:2, partial [Gigaspora margarita]
VYLFYRAAFNSNVTEIIAAERKKYFYSFNIGAGSIDKSNGIYGFQDKSLEKFSISPCGQYIVFAGNSECLVLISNRTKQWIVNMKMNGTVTSGDWSNDSYEDISIEEWLLLCYWGSDMKFSTLLFAICAQILT